MMHIFSDVEGEAACKIHCCTLNLVNNVFISSVLDNDCLKFENGVL